jgi:predicted transcriptional regulator of viral defense system
MMGSFGIAEVERLCLNVSRDTIRLVMNRWRKEGRMEILGRGRDAKWRRKDEKQYSRINVGINVGLPG